jgi:hypothetical protein
VRRVYAHLGTVRHRSEVLEFRVEQHHEKLKDRLGALGFVTRNDTRARAGVGKQRPRQHGSASGGRCSGVGPARLERATSCSGGKRSIQLSYGPGCGRGKVAGPESFRNANGRRWASRAGAGCPRSGRVNPATFLLRRQNPDTPYAVGGAERSSLSSPLPTSRTRQCPDESARRLDS